MHRDRVLDGGFKQFLVGVGAERDRALDVARVFAAIDEIFS
jgi:hypothetical protein